MAILIRLLQSMHQEVELQAEVVSVLRSRGDVALPKAEAELGSLASREAEILSRVEAVVRALAGAGRDR